MKTVCVTHGWLDCPNPGYERRLERFMNHYGDSWPVIYVDNGSAMQSCLDAAAKYGIDVAPHQPNFPRGEGNDYQNVWRVYGYIRDILPHYEKVIFLATDAYICSQRLVDYIEGIDKGWSCLAGKHHPLTEISVICKGSRAFDEFTHGDIYKYHGLMEELVVPVTEIHGFVGDRYGEMGAPPWIPGMDFYTQVPDDPHFSDDHFPILRRKEGKVVVIEPGARLDRDGEAVQLEAVR